MPNPTVYDTDFYLWTQQQADLIRRGLFSELDTAHLIDEIEDMGRSNRLALESYLSNVMMHLLKWQYQPDRRGTSWRATIDNGRYQANRRLKSNPSLKPLLSQILGDEYHQARKNASWETGLPLATFPDQCPFTVEQVLDTEYWPD